MRIAIAASGLTAVGALLLMGAVIRPAEPPKPEPLRSNIELLGEVATIVDEDSPLYRELAADDARNHRHDRFDVETGTVQ